ncbi:alpha/beta fold hydrolase [Nocardia sp. alder85J]|uniref:alpha/beta fold hydrolase n=1 Tax=Nocardia sp. alder85J TaxID=2862949 RepID=UPI001CD4A35B|nr:alpha/beta hydrolase [Nocardia sp. alder85J]MCX4093480.1 alpha/beta hydrolase [Nocardia sp. alder85J]
MSGRRFGGLGEAGLHIVDEGAPAAKPLVLLHGFGGSLHWYARVAPLLAGRFRVIRPDLRGHGGTGGHHDLDAPAQGRAIAALLDALELDDVTVAGHSFGADVALAAAGQSGRVRWIVLIDQAPDYRDARFPVGNGLLAAPGLGPLLHRAALPPFVRLGLRYGAAPGFDLRTAFDDPDQGVRDYRAMSPHMPRVVLVDRRRRLAVNPLDAQLRALGLPTLVLHGSHDRFYDCATTAARYRATGARVEIIDGAGHSPNIERPAAVADLIAGFLGR